MHIVRRTPTELVLKDSSLWISIPFLIGALVFAVVTMMEARPKGMLGVGFMLLFAAVSANKIVFTFDGRERVVRWRGRKLFKVDAGEMPFDDIGGVGTETTRTPRGGTAYRLVLKTMHGARPLAYAYSGAGNFEQMRAAILAFVDAEKAPDPARAGEETVRALVRQGRRTEAIELLRSAEQLDLAEATERVEAMERRESAN